MPTRILYYSIPAGWLEWRLNKQNPEPCSGIAHAQSEITAINERSEMLETNHHPSHADNAELTKPAWHGAEQGIRVYHIAAEIAEDVAEEKPDRKHAVCAHRSWQKACSEGYPGVWGYSPGDRPHIRFVDRRQRGLRSSSQATQPFPPSSSTPSPPMASLITSPSLPHSLPFALFSLHPPPSLHSSLTSPFLLRFYTHSAIPSCLSFHQALHPSWPRLSVLNPLLPDIVGKMTRLSLCDIIQPYSKHVRT